MLSFFGVHQKLTKNLLKTFFTALQFFFQCTGKRIGVHSKKHLTIANIWIQDNYINLGWYF